MATKRRYPQGGRRRKLSLEQEEEVYEYVKSREALHSPLEPVELGHWISRKLGSQLGGTEGK